MPFEYDEKNIPVNQQKLCSFSAYILIFDRFYTCSEVFTNFKMNIWGKKIGLTGACQGYDSCLYCYVLRSNSV